MADICLFVSIYRVVSLTHQNGWGLTGCRRSDGFGFGLATSRNTFVGKEIMYSVCFGRASDGWMRVHDGIGIAMSGLYLWIGCFGMDFTGETEEVVMRIRMVGLDTMSVNLRNESAL
jgi:hypothetical protein